MLKLPKSFHKLNKFEQSVIIQKEIQATEARLQQLLKISRSIMRGNVIASDGIEDRPDIANLKADA